VNWGFRLRVILNLLLLLCLICSIFYIRHVEKLKSKEEHKFDLTS
jgi:hypothetical protein